jgi:hypothetical protein
MSKKKQVVFMASISILLSLILPLYAHPQISMDEILDKNVRAAGGMEKIASIKNFSFKDGQTIYYLSSAAQMKMTSGKDPAITEVILVDQKSAIRNCFNKLSDFGPLLEQTFQTRAKLYSGLFTLLKFKDELESKGTKRFGPKEFHVLTTKTKDLEVQFYIDTTDFLLKRFVFLGHNPDFGKYEVNHDLGPFQEVNGMNIPSSWFASQVGTRGDEAEISDVKWNLDLAENFFTDYSLNAGNTDFSEGVLKGNIVDFEIGRGGQIMISTNWTDDCFKRAGFASGDKLVLSLGDSQMEVDFYTSQPPRSAYGQGAILMIPARGNENYVVYVLASGYQDLAERLEPLRAIQVKKKN